MNGGYVLRKEGCKYISTAKIMSSISMANAQTLTDINKIKKPFLGLSNKSNAIKQLATTSRNTIIMPKTS